VLIQRLENYDWLPIVIFEFTGERSLTFTKWINLTSTLRDVCTADAAASPEADRSHRTTTITAWLVLLHGGTLLFRRAGYEKHIASSRANSV